MSVQIQRSGIEVREATDEDVERWDRYVERSPHANPFHRYEALEVMATHSGAQFHPLVGFKGQEPVGIFPVYAIHKGPMSAVFSPPPNLYVPYLGPALLNFENLKQRKAEKRHKRFVNGCLDWIEAELDPKYSTFRTDGRYTDVRPLLWNDFEATPRYTYVVDLTPGEEDVMMSFSSDARNNIRSSEDTGYEVEVGGHEAIDEIIAQVQSRFAEQGKTYGVSPAFFRDLYDRLPEGQVRPYALSLDGELLGGMVAIESDDTIYRWQGGAKHDHDLPVTDLVDWAIITDAIDRGLDSYDLVGANKERLCSYKAKFDPSTLTYYSLEKGTRSMNVVSNLYKKFR